MEHWVLKSMLQVRVCCCAHMLSVTVVCDVTHQDQACRWQHCIYHTKTQFPHFLVSWYVNSLMFRRRRLWSSWSQNLWILFSRIIYYFNLFSPFWLSYPNVIRGLNETRALGVKWHFGSKMEHCNTGSRLLWYIKSPNRWMCLIIIINLFFILTHHFDWNSWNDAFYPNVIQM